LPAPLAVSQAVNANRLRPIRIARIMFFSFMLDQAFGSSILLRRLALLWFSGGRAASTPAVCRANY
jgi:hypothetical protein